ncbi:CUB domain-containing protein [Caenorhabditis elegans]|uniref:CUB domain-containing protein n=1 Tax=Caenorhabditis elegans TaxID=6239 RepID=Q20743_CAEEL|nr:CUB domain-containing protein [Caenorhabditis elegans]CAA94140.2 CUB domain-containing protein [Caenorhabditis elegans]|eukprot:NP_510280.2 Uncharacterized protein CELE_F54B11.9 [Caenorhabditis elegans]
MENLCTPQKTCFASPKNCIIENCHIIISISENTTELYTYNLDFTEIVSIYTYENNRRQDNMVLCFGGLAKCFLGREEKRESYRIERKQITELNTIRGIYGQYLYKFPRILFETGQNFTYAYRTSDPGDEISRKWFVKLHHFPGSKEHSEFRLNLDDIDSKTISELYETYGNMSPPDEYETDIPVDPIPRNKKGFVNTISIHDLLRDRFVSNTSAPIF